MTESTINFNPAKFAGGVAKSFVSATKSTIASYMPFTSELLQDASDTAFDIRSYINENRPDKTSRNSSGILRTFTNKVYNTSKNFLSDLSHGNLSLDRTRQGLTDYIKKNTQSEFDFDFDFDFDDEDNGEMPEAEAFTAEDYAQGVYESTMATVGAIEISTNKLALMNAKSNNILGDRLIATEMSNMAQSMQMLNTVNDNISGINENLASLIEYNNTTMNDFIKNTAVHFNKVEQFMDMIAKRYADEDESDEDRENERLKKIADSKIFDGTKIRLGNLFKKAIVSADTEFAGGQGLLPALIKLGATAAVGGDDNLPKFLKEMYTGDLSMLVETFNPAEILFENLFPGFSGLKGIDNNIKTMFKSFKRKLTRDKSHGGFWKDDSKVGSFFMRLFTDEDEYKPLKTFENKEASWMTSDSEVLQTVIPQYLSDANKHLFGIRSSIDSLIGMIDKMGANDIKLDRHLLDFHYNMLKHYERVGSKRERDELSAPLAYIENQKRLVDRNYLTSRRRNRQLRASVKSQEDAYAEANDLIFDDTTGSLSSRKDILERVETAEKRAYGTGLQAFSNKVSSYVIGDKNEAAVIDSSFSDWENENKDDKASKARKEAYNKAVDKFNEFHKEYQKLVQGIWHGSREEIDAQKLLTQVDELLEKYQIDSLTTYQRNALYSLVVDVSEQRKAEISNYDQALSRDRAALKALGIGPDQTYLIRDATRHKERAEAAGTEYDEWNSSLRNTTDMFRAFADAALTDAIRSGQVKEDEDDPAYRALKEDADRRFKGMQSSYNNKMALAESKHVASKNFANYRVSAAVDAMLEYSSDLAQEFRDSGIRAVVDKFKDFSPSLFFSEIRDRADDYKSGMKYQIRYNDDGEPIEYYIYSKSKDNWGKRIKVDKSGEGVLEDDPTFKDIWNENIKNGYDQVDDTDFRQFRYKTPKEIKEEQEQSTNEGILHRIQSALGWVDDEDKLYAPTQYKQPNTIGFFATGATRINADQIARVHEGEMILDKSLSQEVRDDIVTMLNNGGYNSMSEEWQQKLLKAIGDSDERFKGHEMEVVKAVNRVVDRYSPETIKSMALKPSDESLCFIDIDENDDPASILVKKLTEMSINLGIMTQTALGTTERENRERGFEKTGKAKNLLLGDKGEGDLRHGGLLSDAYNQIVDDIRYKRFMYIDGKKYTGYTRDEAGNIIEGAGLKSYHATGENATATKNIMDELRTKAKENAFAYAESQGWSNDRTWSYVKTVDSLVQGIPGAVKGGLIGLTLSGVLGSAIGIMGGFTLGNKETREYIFGKVETDSNGRKYVSGGVFGGFTNRLIEAGEDIKTNFKSAFSDVTNNLKLGFKSFLKRITNSNEDSVGNGIAKFLEQVITGKDGTIVTRFLNSLKNTVGRVAEGATDIAIDAVTIGSKLMFKAASVPFNVFASIIGGKEYRADKKKERREARSKQLKEIYKELVFNDSLIGINPDHDITKMFPKIKNAVKNKFTDVKSGVVNGWTSLQNRLAEENETYKKLNRTRHIFGKGGYLSDLPSNIANRWDRLGYINEHYYKAQGKLPHLLGRSGMIDDYVVNPLKRFGASAATAAGKVKEKGKTVFDKMSEGISSIGKALTGEYGQSILRGLMGAILATPLAITGHPLLAGSVLAAGTANAIFKQILGTGMLGIFSTGLKAIGGRVKNITKPIGEFIGNRVHAVKERLGIDDSKFYFRRMMHGSHIDRGGMLSDLGYTTEEQQRYFELMKKDPSELTPDERMFINGIQNSVSVGHRATSDDEEAQRVLNEESEYKILKNKKDLKPEEKERLKELTATVGDRKWFRFKRNHGLTDFAIKHGRGKSALKKLNNLSIDDFNLAKSSLDFKSTLSSRITPEMFASMGITDTGKMNKIQAEADKELKKLRSAVIKRFGSLDAAMDYPDELRAMIMQSGFDKNEQALNGKTAKEMIAFLRNGDTQSIIQEQNFRETLLNVVPVMGQTITQIYEGLKKAFFEKKPASGDLYHKQNEDMAANAFDGENYSTAEHTSDELKDKLKESLANPEKETKGLIDKVSDAYEDVKDVMKPGAVDYSDLFTQIGAPEVSSNIPAGGELITNAFQLIPAKASGATNIDVDGLYKLHKGEIVLDPESANSFRRNIGTGGLDSNALNDISASLRVLSGRDVKKPNKLFNLFGGDEDGKEGGIKGIFSSMKEKLSGLLNVFTGDKTGSDEEKKSFLDKIGESFAGVGGKISGAVMGSGLIPLKPNGQIDVARIVARVAALIGGVILLGPTIGKLVDKVKPFITPIFDAITGKIGDVISNLPNIAADILNGIASKIKASLGLDESAGFFETWSTLWQKNGALWFDWLHKDLYDVKDSLIKAIDKREEEETAMTEEFDTPEAYEDYNKTRTDLGFDKTFDVENDPNAYKWQHKYGISGNYSREELDTKFNDLKTRAANGDKDAEAEFQKIFGTPSTYATSVSNLFAKRFEARKIQYIDWCSRYFEAVDTYAKNFASHLFKWDGQTEDDNFGLWKVKHNPAAHAYVSYLTNAEYQYITSVYNKKGKLQVKSPAYLFIKVIKDTTNNTLPTKLYATSDGYFATKDDDANAFANEKYDRAIDAIRKRTDVLNGVSRLGNRGAELPLASGDIYADIVPTHGTVLAPSTYDYETGSTYDPSTYRMFNDAELANYSEDIYYGYTQNDPRWARQAYGSFKNGHGSTIGAGGCGPTAMANVYSNLTGRSMNPAQMARFSQFNGYNAQGGTSAGLFTNGARKLGLASRAITRSGNAIGNSIRHGNNVIIAGRNGPYTRSGHIMSVRGVDSRGNAIVDDPLKRGSRRIPMNRLTKGMTHAWSIGYGEETGPGGQQYSIWNDKFLDGEVTYNRNGGAFGYFGPNVGGPDYMDGACIYNSFVNGYINALLGKTGSISEFVKRVGWTPSSLYGSGKVTNYNGSSGVTSYSGLASELEKATGFRVKFVDYSDPTSAQLPNLFNTLYTNLSAGNPILFSSNNGSSVKLRDIISTTAEKQGHSYTNTPMHGVLLAGIYKDKDGNEFVVVDNPNTGRAASDGTSNQMYAVPMDYFKTAVLNSPKYDIHRVVVFDKSGVVEPKSYFESLLAASKRDQNAHKKLIETFGEGADKFNSYEEYLASVGGTISAGNVVGDYTSAATQAASGITSTGTASGPKNATSIADWISNIISDLADFGTNFIGAALTGDGSWFWRTSNDSGISGGGTGGYSSYTDGSYSAIASPQLIIDAAFVKSSIESAYSAYSSNTEVNTEFNKNGLSKYTINPGNYASLTNDSRYNQLLIDIAASVNYKKYVTQTIANIYTWLVAQKAISQYPDEKMYAYASKYSSGGTGAVIDNIASEMYNKIKGMQISSGQPTDEYSLLPSWAKTSAGNGIPSAGNEANTLHYLMDLMTKAETGGDIKNPADIDKIYFNPIWLSGESGVTIGRGGFYNANAKTVFTTAAKSPTLSETTRNIMNTIAAGIGNHSLNPSDIKTYIAQYPDMKPALITAQDAMMNEYAWDYISRAAAQYNKRGMKDPRSIILGAEFAGVAPATVPSFYSAVTSPGASNELDQVRQGMFNTISGFSNYGKYGKGWRNRINGMYSMITSEGNGKNPWNGIYYPLPAHIISSIPSNMNLIPTSIGNGDAGYNMRDNDNIYTNDVYMGDADNPMHVVMDSSPVTSRIDKLIELIDSAVNPKEVTQAGPSNAKSNSIGHGEPNAAQAPTMSATKGQSSIGQKDRLAQLHSKLAKRTRTNLNYNHL